MSNISIPNFSSEELREALAEATPVIGTVDEARTAMSEDIKRLEAHLQRLNLKVSFRFPLGMSFTGYEDMPDYQIHAALDNCGAVSAWIEQDALLWDQHQPSGKFRLMYEHNRWDGGVDIDAPGGPFFWDEKTLEREIKPLIETKFEIRKGMYTHLADFVRALSNHCQIAKPVAVDDIPF